MILKRLKKLFPIILSLSSLLIIAFFWEQIKLPYDNSIQIFGEYYYRQHNSLNDNLRFLIFILIPCLIYLTSYLKFNKKNTYRLHPQNKEYFLNNSKKNYDDPLKLYLLFFIILILIEFFSLDFSKFIGKSDLFHDGTYLVPPINYLQNKNFFKSTFYDYGLTGNNLGLISNYLLGYYNLSSINLIKIILVFLVKLFLILISKKTTTYLNLHNNTKKIFFIILCFFAISLPNYYDQTAFFNARSCLYLFFILFLGSTLCDQKKNNLQFFLIGTFSIISILWWFDVGAYVNALLLVTTVYLLIHKEFKKTFFILLGVLFAWSFFLLIAPSSETKEFLTQIQLTYSGILEYLLGIEYPQPFSTNSSRWTKALLIIYVTSLMIINFNLSKKFYIDYRAKIFVSLIFISGVLLFKSALMRSDAAHIKYSSGLYTYTFIFLIFLFLLQRIENNKPIKTLFRNIDKKIKFKSIPIFFLVFSFFFASGMFNGEDSIKNKDKIKNFINFKQNILTYVKTNDNKYISDETKSIIKYYKKISKKDKCVQIFSDDVVLIYFLQKPSCTQFFIPAQIVNGFTEKEFISQLKKNSPNIILYNSPTRILSDFRNMPNAKNYIDEKYIFFSKYKGYIFFKLKQT